MSTRITLRDHRSWLCATRNTPNRLRLSFIVLAICATHIIWAFSYWIASIGLHVQTGSSDAVSTVDSFDVVVATAIAGFAAWGVALLLERFVARARMIWTVGGLLVLGISLVLGPFSATTTGAAIVLLLMHLAAGLLLIVGFRGTLRNR